MIGHEPMLQCIHTRFRAEIAIPFVQSVLKKWELPGF